MNGAVNAPDGARLDELAAVTKEYATYSRSRSGIANVAAGATLLVAFANLSDGRLAAADLLVVLAPLVWLGVLPLARARYQRRGVVVEPERGPSAPQPVLVYAASVITILWRLMFRGAGSEGLLAVQIAALVAMPTLAGTFRHRLGDVSSMATFLGPAMVPVDLWPWWKWVVLAYGVLAVWRGAYEHWRWRRLERRLAALKERA